MGMMTSEAWRMGCGHNLYESGRLEHLKEPNVGVQAGSRRREARVCRKSFRSPNGVGKAWNGHSYSPRFQLQWLQGVYKKTPQVCSSLKTQMEKSHHDLHHSTCFMPTSNQPDLKVGLGERNVGKLEVIMSKFHHLQQPVLEYLKSSGTTAHYDAVLRCIRSTAMALLWFSMSLNIGVMDVEAQIQVEETLGMQEVLLEGSGLFGNTNESITHVSPDVKPSSSVKHTQNGELFQIAESETFCEETYGILPCSKSVGGNVSLMLAYGYLLFTAAKLISEGSELLLEVMNPGLLGGLLLPILGAFPDSILILVSGIGGSPQQAQEEVMVGVGVLAGSSVMLLTVAWAGSLLAGRCDLTGPSQTAKDLTLSSNFNLIGTGVTTDEQTRVGAWIMMASTLPFLFAQLPLLPGHIANGPQGALAGCIFATLGLFSYSAYQVASPWLQTKRIEEARLQFFRSKVLQRVSSFPTKPAGKPRFLNQEEGQGPSVETVKSLFHAFDKNKDGKIQQDELRGLIIGIGLEEAGFVPAEEQVETWLHEFDLDADGTISEHEFVTGLAKWAKRVAQEKIVSRPDERMNTIDIHESDFWAAKSNEAKAVLELLENEAGAGEEEEIEGSGETSPSQIYKQAALYMTVGAAMAAIFADPMVDSIGNFSTASGVPPFFVAFVVTPFASNASELVSSIIFAKKKRKRHISLTFSQIYGAITMNNTLCMAIFLALVYIRGLTWDFSSEIFISKMGLPAPAPNSNETIFSFGGSDSVGGKLGKSQQYSIPKWKKVTVIVACTFAVGILTGTRSTFPAWTAFPVLALYPLAIAGVAFLDTALGWH